MAQKLLLQLKQIFVKKLLHRSQYDYLICIAILAYGIIFSYYTIGKHYGFATFAWDLGIFDQTLHTTLYNGKVLYTTTELYSNPSGCYLGVHFSPILFVLLPFYAVYPSAISLLIFQSFILALGALPLYLISSDFLENRKAGFLIGLVYLLYPALQAANWFDFHQQAFIPVLIFCLYYFLLKKSWKLYFPTLLLTLMIEEHLAPIVFLLGAYFLLTSANIGATFRSIRHLQFSKLRPNVTSLALYATLAISTVLYFIARYVRLLFPIVPQFWDIYRAADTFQVLGFQGDILALPAYVLLNPQRALVALLTDYHLKFLYIVFLFAPLLFVSFRSKISVVTFIILAPFLLTNYKPYYMLGAQYPLHIIPLIFLAAVEGLSHRTIVVKDPPTTQHALKLQTNGLKPSFKTMLAVSLIFIISLSPISPVAYVFTQQTPLLWYAKPYSNEGYLNALHYLIDMVPSNASILTQNNIFPHFSNRLNAYVIPPTYTQNESINDAFRTYIREQINRTDFVLFDLKSYDVWTPFVISEISKDEIFNPLALGGSAILFKRGYNGSAVFIPYIDHEIFLAKSDFFNPGGQIVNDETSKSGDVAFSPKSVSSNVFLYGPYVFLPQGMFNVTFEIKIGNHDDAYIGTLDISENYGASILAKKDIYGFELQSNIWTNITLSLTSTSLKSGVEFRVFSSGRADIYADRVIIERIS